MSQMKRNMCLDCGQIALPQDRKYCSYCDPDEHNSFNEWISKDEGVVRFGLELKPEWISAAKAGWDAGYKSATIEPEGVNAYREGYEAGYLAAKQEMGG